MSTNTAEHPYGFPFVPYPQQLKLMGSITECMETGKIVVNDQEEEEEEDWLEALIKKSDKSSMVSSVS
eukprot:gene8723-10744_t